MPLRSIGSQRGEYKSAVKAFIEKCQTIPVSTAPHLRGDVDHVVLGAPEAGGAEPVAVQAGADLRAVGD